MDTFGRFLAAVALDMCRPVLALSPTVLALSNGTTLFVDVSQRALIVLAIADPVAANTRFASILLALDEHIAN